MTLFVILALSTLIGGIYAYSLWRSENRRQQWRQESRAAWVKS